MLAINWNTTEGVALIIACVAVVVLISALWAFFSNDGVSRDFSTRARQLADAVAEIRTAAERPAVKRNPEDVVQLNRTADCIRDHVLTPLNDENCSDGCEEDRRSSGGWLFTFLSFGHQPQDCGKEGNNDQR